MRILSECITSSFDECLLIATNLNRVYHGVMSGESDGKPQDGRLRAARCWGSDQDTQTHSGNISRQFQHVHTSAAFILHSTAGANSCVLQCLAQRLSSSHCFWRFKPLTTVLQSCNKDGIEKIIYKYFDNLQKPRAAMVTTIFFHSVISSFRKKCMSYHGKTQNKKSIISSFLIIFIWDLDCHQRRHVDGLLKMSRNGVSIDQYIRLNFRQGLTQAETALCLSARQHSGQHLSFKERTSPAEVLQKIALQWCCWQWSRQAKSVWSWTAHSLLITWWKLTWQIILLSGENEPCYPVITH